MGSDWIPDSPLCVGNSIVEQAADPVDVFGDRDRRRGFVRSDSRLRRHDISCRRAVFGLGADDAVGNLLDPLACSCGSIPFIAEFAAAFPEAKILVTGVEDPATQAHSVNESLDLGVLQRAAVAEAPLLANLA